MTLAIAPYKYEDFIKICGECFVDDISGLTASMFVNSKVCCPCTNKLYANKYTFIHQHCKTKKHIVVVLNELIHDYIYCRLYYYLNYYYNFGYFFHYLT